MIDAFNSTSYFYSSTTNTGEGGTTTGHRYSTASSTDKDGNTIVRTARQDMGQPPVIEERRYDRSGQEELLPPTEVSSLPATAEGVQQRITDLDEETTTYGHDSGMTLYALGAQDGTAWEKAGGQAAYEIP